MPRSMEKILVWIIQFCTGAILLLPLLVTTQTMFPFIFGKMIFFRVCVEVAFAAWLLLVFYKKEYRVQWRHPITIGLSVFVGVLVFTMVTGVDFWNSFWSTQERMTGVLTFVHFWAWYLVLAHTFKKWNEWRILFLTSVGASMLVIMYGLFNLGMPSSVFIGSLGNTIYIGSYAGLHIFLALFLLLKEKSILVRLLLPLAIFANVWALLSAGSRGAFFSLALAACGYLLFLLFFVNNKNSRLRMGLTIGILALVCAGGIFAFRTPSGTDFGKRYLPPTLARVLYSQSHSEDREVLWGIGIRGFLDRPMFGWGWENYRAIYEKHLIPRPYMDPWYDRSHNQLIDILALTGVFGFCAYLFLWGGLFWSLFQRLKRTDKQRERSAVGIIGAFFLFYFLQNLTIFDSPAPLFIFFFTLACVTAISTEMQEKKTPDNRGLMEVVPWVVPLLPILVLSLFFSYTLNILPFVKSIEGTKGILLLQQQKKEGLELLQQSLSAQTFINQETMNQVVGDAINTIGDGSTGFTDSEIKRRLFFLIQEAEKQVALHPYTPQNTLSLATLYINSSAYDKSLLVKAEKTLNKALEVSPNRREIYTLLSELALAKGELKSGIAFAQKALTLGAEKDHPTLHWLLAKMNAGAGKFDETFQELDKAEKMGYDIYHDSVIAKHLAFTLSSKSKNPKALDYIDKAVARNSDDIYFLSYRAIIYKKMGPKDKAEKLFEDLKGRNADAARQVKEILGKR